MSPRQTDAYRSVIERLAQSGTGGGRTYDALIGASVASAGATLLLTFNASHFDTAPKGLTIAEP